MGILRASFGPAALLGALAAAGGGGCQLFVDTEVAAGLGAPCDVDSDCHASVCRNRVCSVACSDPDGCPETEGPPPACGQGIDCELPLRVGVLYRKDPGSGSAEDWTRGHEAGIESAIKGRSKITLVTREVEDKPQNVGPTDEAIRQLIDDRCDVIIATSPSMGEAMERSAQQPPHAGIKYLTCGGKQASKNHVVYFGQMYKAAYFAGVLAALRSSSHTLGIIGAFVTPTVVAYINAFAVGANEAVPGTRIHVNWMKDWYDRADFSPPQTIAQLTSELLNGESDGLAYQVDDRKPVTVARMMTGKSLSIIGNDVLEACPAGAADCIGVTRWSWGPMYKQLFDMLQGPEPMKQAFMQAPFNLGAPENNVAGFVLSEAFEGAASADDPVLAVYQEELGRVEGLGESWSPFGGRCFDDVTSTCVSEGTPISDSVLQRMCWFVTGLEFLPGGGVPQEQDCKP